MADTVMRQQIADYLDTGTGDAPSYALMGVGFNTLDESPNAQKDSKTYVHQKAQTTTIKGYQTTFAFDTDLISSDEAVMALYDIGRNQKIGGDAEVNYVRVELFQPVTGADAENTFHARRFKVAVEVASIAGEGGGNVKVTGNLNGVGDFIDGTFNTTTRAFTANE